MVSGRLHVTHDDGSEGEAKPGVNVKRIATRRRLGVGDEPAVFIEFQGADNYAKG